MKKRSCVFIGIFSIAGASMALAGQNLIPINDEDFYYEMGGGRTYTLAPTHDKHSVPLKFEGELGLGYSCGAFNPMAAIRNALNRLKGSFQDVDKTIINNLTGAVMSFPMYKLSEINPNFYKILNNNLVGAHKKLELATKSCEQVEAEIAQGKNPYDNWASVSLGSQWKKEISLARNTGSGDIIHTQEKLRRSQGEQGVPWLEGYAGGQHQPPIVLVSDTTQAGYNSLLKRNLTDNSEVKSSNNIPLTRFWKTPQEAISWVTAVLGDKHITTCMDEGCQKRRATKTGRGLLPWVEVCTSANENYCATTLRDKLNRLVKGEDPLSKNYLDAVSAPGVMLSPIVIEAIQAMPLVSQAIMVEKLAQEIAMQHVIERALMARRLLLVGSQVPAISSHSLAQEEIKELVSRLDSELNTLLFEQQIRKQTTSSTLKHILDWQTNEQAKGMRTPRYATEQPPLLDSGGVMKEKKNFS